MLLSSEFQNLRKECISVQITLQTAGEGKIKPPQRAERRKDVQSEGPGRLRRDSTGWTSQSGPETQCSHSLWQPLAAYRAREVIDIEIEIEIELEKGREACGSHANQGEGKGDIPILGSPLLPGSQLLLIHNLLQRVGLSSFLTQRLWDQP